jgi:hypothetical protein
MHSSADFKVPVANSVFPLFRSTLGIDVPPATLLRANEVIE